LANYTAFTYRVPDNHRHSIIIDIEMDILRMTDMAITNAGGVTVLSLRSPSADKHIDFTKQ